MASKRGRISAGEARRLGVDAADRAQFYRVDQVLDQRTTPDGRVELLIKWQGYSRRDATWEPAEHLREVNPEDEWRALARRCKRNPQTNRRQRGWNFKMSIHGGDSVVWANDRLEATEAAHAPSDPLDDIFVDAADILTMMRVHKTMCPVCGHLLPNDAGEALGRRIEQHMANPERTTYFACHIFATGNAVFCLGRHEEPARI